MSLAAQTVVDYWAATAAGVAAGALAVRANMLDPTQGVWAHAPWPVSASIKGLALALAMGAITIGGGAHATPREAVIYSVLAIGAVILLRNLNRHGRGDLIDAVEAGLEPDAREIYRRHVGRAQADMHGARRS